MQVTVSYQDEEQEIELEEGASVGDALKAAGITIQDVIPKRDGTVVTDDDTVEDGDRIDATRVISGG